jgi:predicted ATPase
MGKSNIGKDFWIKRSAEEATFKKAMDRHKQGFGGGILVLGERNGGKTALSKEIFQNSKTTTYSVFPPTQGNASVEAFNHALSKATLLSGDSEQILSRLPLGSVLIINDLELFWERNTEGLAVIHHLEKLMDTFGQRMLFVINMNPHSYRLINQLTTLGDQFIEIVNLSAFDAKELKDLIMKRHRSSGLPIGYKVDTDSLSEVQQAQLFNKYFNYSEGNPGTALNGWLANIMKHSSEGLIISKPSSPSLGSIKELNEDWSMLLTQFVLHKRLTVAKISRICEWDKAKIRSQLFAMVRAGIVQEKAAGVYHTNPFVHPFVVKSLKEKEVLR